MPLSKQAVLDFQLFNIHIPFRGYIKVPFTDQHEHIMLLLSSCLSRNIVLNILQQIITQHSKAVKAKSRTTVNNAQHNTSQHSTALHGSTALHAALHLSALQICTAKSCTVQHKTVFLVVNTEHYIF